MSTYSTSPSSASYRGGGQNFSTKMSTYSMRVGNPPLGSSARSSTAGTGDLSAYSLSTTQKESKNYTGVRPLANCDFSTSSLMSRPSNPTFAPPYDQRSGPARPILPPITPSPEREEHFLPVLGSVDIHSYPKSSSTLAPGGHAPDSKQAYSRHRCGSIGSRTTLSHLNTSARLASSTYSPEYTFQGAPSAYTSASRSRAADPAMPVSSQISSYSGSALMVKAGSNCNLYDDVSARMPSMTLEAHIPLKNLPNQSPSQLRAENQSGIPSRKDLEGMDVGHIDKCAVHSSSGAQSSGSIDKKHKCDFCLQAFARRHDRDRHERMHTGEKPYVCGHCSKGFMRSDALSRHRLVEPRCGRY